MPQLFRPVADTIARIVLIAVLATPFVAMAAGYAVMNTSPIDQSRSSSRCRSATRARISPSRCSRSSFFGVLLGDDRHTRHSFIC
ncbi:MAG: hypothetical protein P8Y71_08550 [Pseudolabrys sp.]